MHCLKCNIQTNNAKFCSRSCAVSFNNKTPKRKKTRPRKKCVVCDKKTTNPLYCSNICQGKKRFDVTLERFKLGKIHDSNTLKKCMKETVSYLCFICGNTGIHNNLPLVLQLDHIDGNSDNNLPSNLRWLCPNCHTQTPTYAFKGKIPKNTKREIKRRKIYKNALGGTRTPIIGSVDLCPIH